MRFLLPEPYVNPSAHTALYTIVAYGHGNIMIVRDSLRKMYGLVSGFGR